jgi:outer membrane protein
MSTRLRHCLALSLFLFFPPAVRADHSGEGLTTLDSLTQEAIKNSLELKALSEKSSGMTYDRRVAFSEFLPHISLEAGPQISNMAGQRKSGIALYGKAEWNIFRGRIDQIQLKMADEREKSLTKQLTSIENRIRSEVSELYAEMQFIAESTDLKEHALKMNAEQKKIAVTKNSAGFTLKSDVLEFELREATIQSDLVLLNQAMAEKSRKMSALLSRTNSEVSFKVKGHLIRSDINSSRKDILDAMINNNQEIAAIEYESKLLSLEKDKVIAGFYAKVDLEGRYGRFGNSEKVNPEKNDATLLLKVSVPIFSGLETLNQTRSLSSKIVGRFLDGEDRKLQLISEMDILLINLDATSKRLDLEEKNLIRSQAYYDATVNEYKRGIKNSPDMVGASERLFDARIRNLEYRRDLVVGKAKLTRLVGSQLR